MSNLTGTGRSISIESGSGEGEPLKPPQTDSWCLVNGSSWESAQKNGSEQSQVEKGDKGQFAGTDLVGSAFKQIKYELYCASVDLLGYSLEILPNRNCIAKSVYSLTESEESIISFEFVYDHVAHRYTDLVWAEQLQQYAALFQYWILERQCIPGFLAEVLLGEYSHRGTPPYRPRK